jgi:hypothetical protein
MGTGLKDVSVRIKTKDSGFEILGNRTANESTYIKIEITDPKHIEMISNSGTQLMVGGVTLKSIDESTMPQITDLSTRTVKENGSLEISGSNLDDNKMTIDPTIVDYTLDPTSTTSKLILKSMHNRLGLKDIVFKDTIASQDYDNDTNNDETINIQYTYKHQFSLVGELSIGDVQIIPNRGEKGDTVALKAEDFDDDYSVFFLSKSNPADLYSNQNKGKNPIYFHDATPGVKDTITLQVPDLPVGQYDVVLTNPVPEGQDPQEMVTEYKNVGNFSIVQGMKKPKIIQVNPDRGPDSGSTVKISGQFLGYLNIDEFTQDTVGKADIDHTSPTDELIVDYGAGKYDTGTFDGSGDKIIKDVTGAKRYVKVFIGSRATFNRKEDDPTKYDVTLSSDLDEMNMHTGIITNYEDDPIKDVIVETKTTFTFADGTSLDIYERAELKDGYTIISSKIAPKINSIVPDVIQVDENNQIPEKIRIVIHGDNFKVYKNEDESVRYPTVNLGGEITIDPNTKEITDIRGTNSIPNLYFEVLDQDNRIIDGTVGKETGIKIVFEIPSGIEV